MRIFIIEARGQLTDLVRRAEAGDEVVLTGHGDAAVRLVPVNAAHVCFVAGLSAGTVGLPTEERAAALGVARQEAAVLA